MCALQVRFSSISTPSDLVWETLASSGALSSVFSLYLEPINMLSVLDWFRINIFATNHWLTFSRSIFRQYSMSSILLLENVRWVSSAYIRFGSVPGSSEHRDYNNITREDINVVSRSFWPWYAINNTSVNSIFMSTNEKNRPFKSDIYWIEPVTGLCYLVPCE